MSRPLTAIGEVHCWRLGQFAAASWYSNWPVTFWITLFSGIAYAGAALTRRAG